MANSCAETRPGGGKGGHGLQPVVSHPQLGVGRVRAPAGQAAKESSGRECAPHPCAVGFKPRIPADFNTRIPIDFKPRIPINFKPSIANDFKPRIPINFKPRIAVSSKPRIPIDFKARIRIDFKPSIPIDFKARIPIEFKARIAVHFKMRIPTNFKPSIAINFKPRIPVDFKPRIPIDFKVRIAVDFKLKIPIDFKARISKGRFIYFFRLRGDPTEDFFKHIPKGFAASGGWTCFAEGAFPTHGEMLGKGLSTEECRATQQAGSESLQTLLSTHKNNSKTQNLNPSRNLSSGG